MTTHDPYLPKLGGQSVRRGETSPTSKGPTKHVGFGARRRRDVIRYGRSKKKGAPLIGKYKCISPTGDSPVFTTAGILNQ